MERRGVLRGAAWAVPVIAAAVSVPLAAASTHEERDRLTFNTAAVWDENPWGPNGNYPLIMVRVGAMDTTGPDPIGAVTIIVTVTQNGGTQSNIVATSVSRPWGATVEETFAFEGLQPGEFTVTLHAKAEGCLPITKTIAGQTA